MPTPLDLLNARILIVDDAPANVLLLERLLQGEGYTGVTSTSDPRTVLDLYREHRHDLILLDLLMPGLDGFEVMAQLQTVETEGYLPVLVLTAQPAHRLRALQAGAKDFVGKPFDRMEVLTRIHNMLEVRLLLRESRDYGRLLEHYDPLTRLPNRARFGELLAQALARTGASSDPSTDPATAPVTDRATAQVTVLCVGLDRFKQVNEALGRETGDALLRAVAGRLTGVMGQADVIARLGGDEFGVIVTAAPGDDVGALVERIRAAVGAPLILSSGDVRVTASVGIAHATGPADETDTLVKAAHTALHSAKTAGRDRYCVFTETMHAEAAHTLDLEGALRVALERGEFLLHYQPKLRIDTGEWSGLEALIRWERSGHGLVPPGEFIAILEETGLIIPVGQWVIDTVCRQLKAWVGTPMDGISVAVNVSSKQFLSAGFVAGVANAVRENGIPISLLDIEITESALLARDGDADRVLRELKTLGTSIAIDDFGTGYSSLSYLKRFPIDTLKIDIQFVRDITATPEGGAIATAIIEMARSLRMTVIAEGVESRPQLEFLRANGCDEIQGYYHSRPLAVDALERLRDEQLSARLAAAALPA